MPGYADEIRVLGRLEGPPMCYMSPLITAVPPTKSENCPSIFIDHDKIFFRYFFNLCIVKANLIKHNKVYWDANFTVLLKY